MAFTLCHFSDLHLERTFAARQGYSHVARARREGLRDALQRICTYAAEHKVDALTIGGDLFDDDSVTMETGKFLNACFAAIPDIQVIISPGNHDPYLERSLYATIRWADNVRIFTEEQFSPVVLTPGLVLWGLAHPNHAWTGDPLSGEKLEPTDDTNIALFHGAEQRWFENRDSEAKHGPFHAADIREKGFRLALCGHYHSYRYDQELGLLYPGTPEPLAIDETGSHGPSVITLDDAGGISVEQIPLNVWNVFQAKVDISSCTSTNDMEAAILQEFQHAPQEGRTTTLCEIELAGRIPSYVRLDIGVLSDRLHEETAYPAIRLINRTSAHTDAEELVGESTVRGHFAKSLLELREAAETDGDRNKIDAALEYGLRALNGEEILDHEI